MSDKEYPVGRTDLNDPAYDALDKLEQERRTGAQPTWVCSYCGHSHAKDLICGPMFKAHTGQLTDAQPTPRTAVGTPNELIKMIEEYRSQFNVRDLCSKNFILHAHSITCIRQLQATLAMQKMIAINHALAVGALQKELATEHAMRENCARIADGYFNKLNAVEAEECKVRTEERRNADIRWKIQAAETEAAELERQFDNAAWQRDVDRLQVTEQRLAVVKAALGACVKAIEIIAPLATGPHGDSAMDNRALNAIYEASEAALEAAKEGRS